MMRMIAFLIDEPLKKEAGFAYLRCASSYMFTKRRGVTHASVYTSESGSFTHSRVRLF